MIKAKVPIALFNFYSNPLLCITYHNPTNRQRAQQAITGTTHNCILRRQIIQNDSEIRPNVLLIINVLCKSFIA